MANDTIIDDESVKKISNTILRRAQQLAPNHLANGIKLTLVPFRDGYSALFQIYKEQYPDARAWEYGSGEHNTTNFVSKHQTSAKSPIRIEGKPFLAFFWETANTETLHWARVAFWKKRKAGEETGLPSFAGFGRDGRLLFNYVLHPGIEAANQGRGYLRLAFSQTKTSTTNSIAKMGVANILKKSRQVFGRVR